MKIIKTNDQGIFKIKIDFSDEKAVVSIERDSHSDYSTSI